MSASSPAGGASVEGHDGDDLDLVDLVDRLVDGGVVVHDDIVLPR
jgi:hypothetical protein